MTRSARAIETYLRLTLKRIGRHGQLSELRSLMMGDAFINDLISLAPRQRLAIMVEAAGLMVRLRDQIGPLTIDTPTKAPKWTPEMIARLRDAHAKYGDDEDIARALSITRKAAERARLRYIGPHQRPSTALAPNALQTEAAWEPSGRPIRPEAP